MAGRGDGLEVRGQAECGERELGHKVLLLSCLGTDTWVLGHTVARMLVCVAAGTDTKAVSAKLTANPGPAPLICCARQDQPSFKHWLPCAGLRWSCAGWRGRCTASRLLCTHSRSPSSHPLFLTTTTTTTTPPPPIAAPSSKTSSVTRRPTSPPCDRSVKIQLSLPSRRSNQHRWDL